MQIGIVTIFVLVVWFSNDFSVHSLRNEFIGDCLYYFDMTYKCGGCYYYNTRKEDIVTFTCRDYFRPINFFESSIMKCSNTSVSLYNRNTGTINFQNCQMPRIKYNIFGVYTKLHTLNMTGIELQLLPKDFFTGASQLRTLIASNNRLLEIPASQFSEVPALIDVDYSFNRISEISEEAFEGASVMKKLNLSHNHISPLHPNTLAKLSSITTLDLSFNNIETFVNLAITVIPKLQNLSLSYNKLTNLTIAGMPSLEVLSLSHNYLTNLTIVGMWNLQFLSLAYNNFTYFELGVLSAMKKLEFLDLSHNFLKRIDFGASRLNHLETFYINDNQLRHMDGFKNALLPTLTSFAISNNMFHCSELEKFLDVFEHHSSLNLLLRTASPTNDTEHRHEITCFLVDESFMDSTVELFESSTEITRTETSDYNDQDSSKEPTIEYNPTYNPFTEPIRLINYNDEPRIFNDTKRKSLEGNDHYGTTIDQTIKSLLIVLCVLCGIILAIIIVRLFRKGESMNYSRELDGIQPNVNENPYETIPIGKSVACA